MADYSTEELEKIADKFRSDTSGIRGTKDFTSPEELYDELKKEIKKYHPSDDTSLVDKAYRVAYDAHKGQARKSGEPYIIHPLCVAIILAELELDKETIAAGLLHDVLEDTIMTMDEMRAEFGDDVAHLVDGVTKLKHLHLTDSTKDPKDKNADRLEMQAENLRKMFLAMAKDIRVILIKLADRLHNMRTLKYQSKEAQQRIARETQDIYCPIAQRLGISKIKIELEDLCMKYLYPDAYYDLVEKVALRKTERDTYIQGLVNDVKKYVSDAGIKAEIYGRAKHFFSIYKKMVNQDKTIDQIYDLFAIRILVDSIPDCYAVLGIIHEKYKPIPGRFKDYIAMPKLNMYQSLHTTVIGPAARPLEVQIRTEEMHRMSEYGVAAHWRYKEKGSKADAAFDRQIAWLRQMVDWQEETKDSREFLNELKVDLAPTEVFVFTPAGEVMSLRAGSTPVDFAYSVHTEVGNHCVGAKVNGSIVPLSYELQTGDRVEILTQKSATPSRDWLKMVKTPSARSKLRQYLSKVSRSDDMIVGREKLAREMKKHGLGLGSTASIRAQKQVCETLGYKDIDDMMVAIGAGKETVLHITNRLVKILNPEVEEESHPELAMLPNGAMPPMITTVRRQPKRRAHASNGVVVEGIDSAPVRLSKCCNPVPGDDIIGFITRGRGVSVHRADCPNATDLMRDPGRLIKVAWEDTAETTASYQIEVFIEALDRMNLLRDIINTLSDTGVNVLASNTVSHSDGIVEMRYLFQVSQISNIEYILGELRKIDGVFDARRMLPGDSAHRRK